MMSMLMPLLEQYGITPEYIDNVKDRIENALISIENMEEDIRIIKEKLERRE